MLNRTKPVIDVIGHHELKLSSSWPPLRSYVEKSDSNLRMDVGFFRPLPGFLPP